jgi:hypothetical protein
LASARTITAGHAFVQNLRRGHHAITADLALHDRVRVAVDERALCPGCHVSTRMLARWIDLRGSYHRRHKCEVVTLLLRW